MTSPSGLRLADLRAFVRDALEITGWRLAWALAWMLGAGLASALALLLLLPIMQAAGVGLDANDPSRAVRWLTALIGPHPSLALAIALFIAGVAVQSVTLALQTIAILDVTQTMSIGMRRRVLDSLGRLDWARYHRERASDLLQLLTTEVERVAMATNSLLSLISTAAIAGACVALAVAVSPAVTAVILAVGAIIMWLLRGQRVTASKMGQLYSAASAAVSAGVLDVLSNMKLFRAYGAFDRQAGEIDDAGRHLRSVLQRIQRIEAVGKGAFELAAASALGLICYLALRWLHLPLAEIVVLLAIFFRLSPRLSGLHYFYQGLGIELHGYRRLVDTIARFNASAPAAARTAPVAFESRVDVSHVRFVYDRDDVLHDVSLTIPAGACVALVGPSGGGKSTLADIVLGLLEPTAGRVEIDGVPLTPERRAAWLAQVAYVPQETFLFHRSARDNLRWAAPQATEAEMIEALRAAAAEFVFEWPQGLDTPIGDRGAQVSGGERQRLSLARALLRRPKLLILDEATGALDTEHERRVLAALEQLRGRVAVLLITHRLHTLQSADCVYVLDGGRVVESGTASSLLASPRSRLSQFAAIQDRADTPVSVTQ